MYSIKDIMLMYSLSERTVRRYLSDGVITGTKIGGVWRFTDVDVDSFSTQKRIKSKLKTEVNQILYDYINTPNPKKNKSHCFSMIDVRLQSKENKELQNIIFDVISKGHDLQMKYYYDNGNYRYVFVGSLDFVEEVTVSINAYLTTIENL